MKIIEALKKTKDYARKLDDLKEKIAKHSADMDFENPVYPDQRAQVQSWVQASVDLVREIGRLKYCIAKTNISTQVTIQIGEVSVTKTISEWIERRKNLVALENSIYRSLTNKNLKDVNISTSNGVPQLSRVRLYFDPKEKDQKMWILGEEPSLIDARLEIVNAVTDLIEN